jgi:hypothetical protein
MRAFRHVVQNPLAAENAGDDAVRRPYEARCGPIPSRGG